MSEQLNPLDFPLHGTRLIEASAGTGKTWTIAALYVRLVLGHGAPGCGFDRPLQPSEILVMTFTRAATRELSDRIRERLVEAAQCFRGNPPKVADGFLQDLLACYGDDAAALEQAAYRLALAAEAMDESAVFTIDAWCQRMLREHAFDSGALFNEELIESERQLFNFAVRDYWRHHVYALCDEHFERLQDYWPNLTSLERQVRDLVPRAHLLDASQGRGTLAEAIPRAEEQILAMLGPIKQGWVERGAGLKTWFARNRQVIKGNIYRDATVNGFFCALEEWAANDRQERPGQDFYANNAWDKWDESQLRLALKSGCSFESEPCADFRLIEELKRQIDALPRLSHFILPHAALVIAQRMQSLKAATRKFGFADMLSRLKAALEGDNAEALRARILARYPIALIDEFQDTSPDQYAIFSRLYDVSENAAGTGLFLIGDPKQAIYGFRGADIHSYLAARDATEGRHYWLARNYRSTDPMVKAVNRLFSYAEGTDSTLGHPKGAFGFRSGTKNPLPFNEVGAHDRRERLVCAGTEIPAMTVWVGNAQGYTNAGGMQKQFSAACAEQIVSLLNDASVVFRTPEDEERLQPADIAVLVKNRYEAAAVQRALRARGVASVYLSDKDSVFKSDEAVDVLRWLQAVSNPMNAGLARCAFGTRTADLPIAELASYTTDDVAWEAKVEQLKSLKLVWQRHGVLAMLRRFLHELRLPERVLPKQGGERSLTNLLHLAELLQRESQRLDGEQSVIRWLAEQIYSDVEEGEENVLRLESDAQLVKIVTIHKSKGLEYPLVFLPFAAVCRRVTAKKRTYFEYLDVDDGRRKLDFTLSEEAQEAADRARLEEDIRLLYVALTRARHAVWLGVADVNSEIRWSAFGYLLKGGANVLAADLKEDVQEICSGWAHIKILDVPDETLFTRLSRTEDLPPLRNDVAYRLEFERDWTVASYSSLTKSLTQGRSPATAAEQKVAEEATTLPVSGPVQPRSWHRFPRGAVPGLFLHGLLEWMVDEGFVNFDQPWYRQRLVERCAPSMWNSWKNEVADWLLQAVGTLLPPLNATLADLRYIRAETEFWIPADRLPTAELDRLCRQSLLPGLSRPRLSERQVNGMLHGFIDLVFEHDGRYWILDYKSTALGNDDSSYHPAALQAAVVEKRYEVQGIIYLLALHRLLKSRLGSAYDAQKQLGGAIFFFLRGIGNATTGGCIALAPDAALLEEFDCLLSAPPSEIAA